jgi:DNA-binding GntR family transcriptional regulator
MLRYVAEVPGFDPGAGDPAYLYAKVADHVALRIAAGDLQAGAMLPAERDMAAEYGVAVGTVRRAIGVLRSRGLVLTLPAKGTFITGHARQPPG